MHYYSMWDNEVMESKGIGWYVFAVVVLFFGVIIITNFLSVDEMNTTLFTRVMFSRSTANVPLVRVVENKTEGMYTKTQVAYPQFVRGPAELNAAILAAVTDEIALHDKNAAEKWNAQGDMQTQAGGATVLPDASNKLPLTISWEPAEINANIISILLRFEFVDGGERSNEAIKTFTYDLQKHKMLTLADVFPDNPNYLEQVSRFSYDSLKQQLTRHFGANLSSAALLWLKDGTAPLLVNYKEFTINHDNLMLYFGQNQIAASDWGAPHVLMPLIN